MTARPRLSFYDRTKLWHRSMPRSWPSTVKHVATVLFTFAKYDDGSGIMCSVKTLAEQAGESERTVQRVQQFLRDNDFLVDVGNYYPTPHVVIPVRRLVLEAIQAVRQLEDGEDLSKPVVVPGEDVSYPHVSFYDGVRIDAPGVKSDAQPCQNETVWGVSNDTQTEGTNRIGIDSTSPTPTVSTRTNHYSSRKRSPRAGEGSRLPEDWSPSDEEAQFARSLGLNPKAVADTYRDYWIAQPGAKGRKVDWPATWRNWCRRQAERQGSAPTPVDDREARRRAALADQPRTML